MTNKERTIQACRDLAHKYRNPEGREFFNIKSCALCRVHFSHRVYFDSDCRGCPLAKEDGAAGCSEFKSNDTAQRARFNADDDATDPKVRKAFEKRAQFFDRIIPILEKWPEERFTAEGWKYSGEEIPREW